jgi:hypothetical protein
MSDEGDDDFVDDEEEEDEELEEDAVVDPTEAVAETDAVDEDETPATVPVGRARKVEQVEVHSTAARAAQRDSIAADVEAFLARGGSIKKIADGDRADPPKKSESNYGRGTP